VDESAHARARPRACLTCVALWNLSRHTKQDDTTRCGHTAPTPNDKTDVMDGTAQRRTTPKKLTTRLLLKPQRGDSCNAHAADDGKQPREKAEERARVLLALHHERRVIVDDEHA
jgi:hypothetical protein